MIARLTRSAVFAVALVVGPALSSAATAMPADGTLTIGASPITKAGLICTWVCLEYKKSVYGTNCVKHGQNCSTSSSLGRILPPPARTTR